MGSLRVVEPSPQFCASPKDLLFAIKLLSGPLMLFFNSILICYQRQDSPASGFFQLTLRIIISFFEPHVLHLISHLNVRKM